MKKILIIPILLLSYVVSSQTASNPVQTYTQESLLSLSDSSLVDRMMTVAASRLGCRYLRAGKGPNAFDCAGFTRWVYLHFGYTLAPYAGGQLPQGTRITDTRMLRPGDLAFYGGRGGGRSIGHVVLVTEVDSVTGRFRFIHAASSGIRYDRSNDGYWSSRFKGCCRILPDEAWVSPHRQVADSLASVAAEQLRQARIADSLALVAHRQDSLRKALDKRLVEAKKDVDAHGERGKKVPRQDNFPTIDAAAMPDKVRAKRQ